MIENYTSNLFTFLEERLGTRFRGCFFVNDEIGFIEGTIDSCRIDLRCYGLIVTYEINNHNASVLRNELDEIIKEYIGINEIKSCNEKHSWTLGSIFVLNRRIDEKEKIKRR